MKIEVSQYGCIKDSREDWKIERSELNKHLQVTSELTVSSRRACRSTGVPQGCAPWLWRCSLTPAFIYPHPLHSPANPITFEVSTTDGGWLLFFCVSLDHIVTSVCEPLPARDAEGCSPLCALQLRDFVFYVFKYWVFSRQTIKDKSA